MAGNAGVQKSATPQLSRTAQPACYLTVPKCCCRQLEPSYGTYNCLMGSSVTPLWSPSRP